MIPYSPAIGNSQITTAIAPQFAIITDTINKGRLFPFAPRLPNTAVRYNSGHSFETRTRFADEPIRQILDTLGIIGV